MKKLKNRSRNLASQNNGVKMQIIDLIFAGISVICAIFSLVFVKQSKKVKQEIISIVNNKGLVFNNVKSFGNGGDGIRIEKSK